MLRLVNKLKSGLLEYYERFGEPSASRKRWLADVAALASPGAYGSVDAVSGSKEFYDMDRETNPGKRYGSGGLPSKIHVVGECGGMEVPRVSRLYKGDWFNCESYSPRTRNRNRKIIDQNTKTQGSTDFDTDRKYFSDGRTYDASEVPGNQNVRHKYQKDKTSFENKGT
jgi:hypothetical protein